MGVEEDNVSFREPEASRMAQDPEKKKVIIERQRSRFAINDKSLRKQKKSKKI